MRIQLEEQMAVKYRCIFKLGVRWT